MKLFRSTPTFIDYGLLILRAAFGGIMALNHGLSKLMAYSEKSENFFSFLGISPSSSMILAILGEFVCGMLMVAGLLTRLSATIASFTMGVAVFIVHNGDSFSDKEHALLYMIVYLLIALCGPGKFSLDALFDTQRHE